MDKERYLIFDESGNLGAQGRYFVIACIDTYDYKALHNIMHKKLGIARKLFPELSSLHANEIKAKDAYPCIKYHLLECIARKNVSIGYIVADLQHVRPKLLEEKNIFYNYLMRLIIEKFISEKDNGNTINIICDNHTTKVASANSFSDYIKLYLLYERELCIKLNIKYLDSDASNAYIVQAADYIANALYTKYEYGNTIYSDLFDNQIMYTSHFPWGNFGK